MGEFLQARPDVEYLSGSVATKYVIPSTRDGPTTTAARKSASQQQIDEQHREPPGYAPATEPEMPGLESRGDDDPEGQSKRMSSSR